MPYKYTLIVSQYSHSRHMYIVKHDPETFIETAKNFARELMSYKRGTNEAVEDKDLGDLVYNPTAEIRSRYNINDYGDIYFINGQYANRLMEEAGNYYVDCYRECRSYVKKELERRIYEHHNGRNVTEILKKYFEIV